MMSRLVLHALGAALVVAFSGCSGCESPVTFQPDAPGTGIDGDDSSDADDGIDADGTPDADLCVGGTLCGSPAACCAAGNECVDDRCLPACASGVYCGASLELCCDSGNVCLENACVVPGAACADPYDCEPGNFCEATLDQCLPTPDPLTCQIVPTFSDLQVTQEWAVTTNQIISIPVIANLDGAGAPEVVVNLSNMDGGSFPVGRIQILNGATGAELLAPVPHAPTAIPPTYGSHGRSTIAVGDVSGDNLPDIIYAARSGTGGTGRSLIIAMDRTGVLLWRSHSPAGVDYGIRVDNGGATLANFDSDPQSEIVFGGTLLDHDGTVIWDEGGNGFGGHVGSNTTYSGGIAAVADLNGDGTPEIITGNRAWRVTWNAATPASTTVTNYWTAASTPDGYPAIADLDGNGTPEVVLVGSTANGVAGRIYLLNGQTGAALAPSFGIPGGASNNIGGPPTIADFDGDGRPEIGVAGGYSYSIYDWNRPGEDISGITPAPAAGAQFVRWSKVTQDLSSNATGSSVFDFQGDGSAEVVYMDECYVRVYSGTDGREQLKLPNTTGTIHEYPLVVDIDGDGNSEIVVVANDENSLNNCPGVAPRRGIYVYGDANDRWVPTRKVWTQHSYHVTNATAAGNVPATELDNWTQPGLNDYRKNAQGEGVFNAPDLALDLAVGLDQCVNGRLVLRARVTNLGSLGVRPGVMVTFHAGTSAAGMLLGTATTVQPLLPGGSTTVTLEVPSSQAAQDFFAVADSAATVEECDELNNGDTATGIGCPVIQ